jgi:serine/threonine protein kinase
MCGYSAPEVASGGPRGDSADVFSLGCVFLEVFVVLTGTATLERARSCRNTAGNRSYQANLEKARALIN